MSKWSPVSWPIPQSMSIGDTKVFFCFFLLSLFVRKPSRFSLDCSLSVHQQVTNTLQHRALNLSESVLFVSIWPLMPQEHTFPLLYCPDWTIAMLCSQMYRNIFWTGCREFRVPLLDSPPQLQDETILLPFCTYATGCQTSVRIQYKIFSLFYSSLSDSGHEYLHKVLQIFTPSRQIRSFSDNCFLRAPPVKTKTSVKYPFHTQALWYATNFHYDIRKSRSKTSL